MNKNSETYKKYKPGTYIVKFETGFTEELQADSQKHAVAKADHLQGSYGLIKTCKLKPKSSTPKKHKSYAEQQASIFQ